MADMKKFDPIMDKNIKISGSEDINIDPVYINVSISGQAKEDYEKIRLILRTAQSGCKLTKKQVEDVHKTVNGIVALAKEAIKKYATKRNEKNKEELKAVIEVVKKAKSTEKAIEKRYILESDEIESQERRALLSGWAREGAENKENAEKIKDIDIPVWDVDEILKDNGLDR